MNKKGFLLGKEMLKIIIAIICIIFLIAVLVSLWRVHIRNKDLELAKASLEHLIKEINAGKTEVRIYNPIGWDFYSFPQPIMEGVVPEYCSNRRWENCICICGLDNTVERGMEQCNKLGYCLRSEFVVEGGAAGGPFRGIMIYDKLPLILSIDHENKIISEKIKIKTDEEEFGGGGATREF